MSGRATGPTEAQTVEPEETEHPTQKEGGELVGVTTRGAPWYYDADANELIERLPEEPDAWSKRESVGTEDLRGLVADLEEGWESLTSDARELLGFEESESGSESESE